jgi:hypothetical protein
MVERYTVGRGYTKRQRVSVDVADLDGMRAVMNELAASNTSVEGRLADAEQRTITYLRGKGMPVDPSAPPYGDPVWRRENERKSLDWYAIEILNTIRILRLQIERGDARLAADLALDVGVLATEAAMIQYNVHTAAGGGRGNRESDRQREQHQAREHDRARAEDLRRRHPSWSVRRIACEIDPARERSIRRTIADLKPCK